MTRKRLLLDVSPTGVQHYAHVGGNDGDELILEEFTPTKIETEILDENSRLRALHQRKGRQLQLAARIPIGTYEIWRKEWREGWADTYTWQTFEVMKLNSRDNGKLRVGCKRSGSKKL